MDFDPATQEYVPEHPLVDRTSANIVGNQNPIADPYELELAAEVVSGVRNLSSLSYSELLELDDMMLGHQTNKMVISEMMARHEQRDPASAERPSPSINVDSSLAKSDTTAKEAFRSDFRNEFKNDRNNDRRDDTKNSRRNL